MGLILCAIGCVLRPNVRDETPKTNPRPEATFDPLPDPRDREAPAFPDSQSTPGAAPAVPQYDWNAIDSMLRVDKHRDTSLTVFRVQLYASQYYSEAAHELQLAQKMFADSAFIKYETPYYKVLLGNATSQAEAARLLNAARVRGYNNSWIVESEPDTIFLRMRYPADSSRWADSTRNDKERGR